MLVLFETAAGYALFKLNDESILQKVDNIWKEFLGGQNESLELVSFKRYKSIAEALTNATALSEGKLSKTLKKMLRKNVANQDEKLAVEDTQLGKLIKSSMEIKCLYNTAVSELMRSIRANVNKLIGDEDIAQQIDAMRLGVAHAVGRYKVKFNPEKIDTMIVQAVSLLDDLDKELNNYVMRCKEWYGWHFPELGKVVTDPQAYAKCVKEIGMKQNAQTANLDAILPKDLVEQVRTEAEISMGTDITDVDLFNIRELCEQIIELGKYRTELHEYLKNRMCALAPNLTVLLGELVGARLISKAGSLVALAKCPASTVQILGAEKALFRALKTKKDTPKYGIIYHAQLITQATQKAKGKIARKLAAKVALSTRVDALCEETLGNQQGLDARVYLEQVIKDENARTGVKKQRFSGVKQAPKDAYTFKKQVHQYDSKFDMTVKQEKNVETTPKEKKGGKRPPAPEVEEEEEPEIEQQLEETMGQEEEEEKRKATKEPKRKKAKKVVEEVQQQPAKKKSKKQREEVEEEEDEQE